MPATIPVLCMICSQTIKGDQAYLLHMQTKHGTDSPDQAMVREKAIKANTPQEPIILDKDTPPSQEFMEMAKMMDQKPPVGTSVEKQSVPPTDAAVQQEAKVTTLEENSHNKPLVLKYRYEGSCPQCNTSVRTIMTFVDRRIFATAYCLTHEDIEQREVAPIPIKKITMEELQRPETVVIEENDHVEPTINTSKALINRPEYKEYTKRKEGKKRGRRNTTKLFHKVAVQKSVQPTGLPKTNQSGLSSEYRPAQS